MGDTNGAMAAALTPISGWGGVPVQARQLLDENLERGSASVGLSRGLGRSYGDCSLPADPGAGVLATPRADRLLSFEESSGLLRAEAGLSLREIYRVFLPRGWFTPVSPGTWHVTLGGMVASDVHGKNHHVAGTFGRHVTALKLRVADGRIVECSREAEPELFLATIGGMGLTGHVLEVEFRMERVPSPWIESETLRIDGLEAFVAELDASARGWPFTVGWVNCLARGRALGRGVLYRGRWADPADAPSEFPDEYQRPSLPVSLPSFTLSRPLVALFNTAFYRLRPRLAREIVHPQKFFYPLDAIGHWNRLYGAAGVTQYQCVLPKSSGVGGVRRLFSILAEHGGTSFLCVIKDCGPEGEGMLSFPTLGTSVALDLPIRAGTSRLVDRLNEIVIAEGGRVYLAKDGFTRPDHFRQMEPRLPAWRQVRERWDPEHKIQSAQSRRLFGDRS